MPKSVFTGAHRHLVEVLVEARHASGLKQSELAERLGKTHGYISIIEGSQRRVDVLEFCALARAMDRDPTDLFEKVVARLPAKLEI